MTDKFDLFAALANIDKKNIGYYDSLPADQKKLFVPVVIMQWLSCTSQPLQMLLVNSYVNRYVFSLYKHPKLLFQLMTVTTDGTRQRYDWKAAPKRKTNFPKSVDVIQQYTNESKRRAIDIVKYMSNDEILDIAHGLGYQPDDIKAINLELKTRV